MDADESRLVTGYAPSHHAGAIQPLAQSLYNNKRSRTDLGWTIAYLLFVTFCFIGGIAIMGQARKSSQNLNNISSAFMNQSLTCDASTWDASWSKLYPGGVPGPKANSTSSSYDSLARSLGKACAIWLPITVVLGIPGSLLFVYLFKNHPLFMVKASVWGTLVALTVLTVVCLAVAWPLGIIMLIFVIVLAVLAWLVRNELELCAELLGVASKALTDNFRLIPTVLFVNLVTIFILIYFMVTSTVAFALGRPVHSGDAVRMVPTSATVTPDVGVCYNTAGVATPCCTWAMGGWPIFYVLITYMFITWTLFIALQIKLHIVADLAAQWYYAPPGAMDPTTAPSLKQAVRHALTTGFGTATFAAAILFLINAIRSAMRDAGRKNIFCAIINCFVQPLLALLEMFTKFASIAAAITGKPLVPAARDMLAAFKRCFLQTTSAWWVPDLVTSVVVASLALAWSSIPFMVTAVASNNWGAAFLVAFFCFIVILCIMNFAAGVLMDLVNTFYVLFALDRDTHMVTRPDVHQVFNRVVAKTSPDAVVEQPDGNINYGRAEEGRAGATAAPVPVAPPGYNVGAHAPQGYTQPAYGQEVYGMPVYGGSSVAAPKV